MLSWWALRGLLLWYSILKWSHCNSFKSEILVDAIYEYLIVKWSKWLDQMGGYQFNGPIYGCQCNTSYCNWTVIWNTSIQSTAAVACEQIYGDQFVRLSMKRKWNFHLIWIMIDLEIVNESELRSWSFVFSSPVWHYVGLCNIRYPSKNWS